MSVSAAAREYLLSMSPTATRLAQDLHIQQLQPTESVLWFFSSPGGQKVLRDETTERNYLDEHSAPFTFRSNSQIDLSMLDNNTEEPPAALAKLEGHQVDRELVVSHSKVLSELKNALKSGPDSNRLRNSKYEAEATSAASAEPPKQYGQDTGFISKLLANKKFKCGNSEEREQLVSSEKRCQIVASSDNYFKTNFGGLSQTFKENQTHEESKALLAANSLQDSLAASTDSEFQSCEDTPVSVASPSSPSFGVPKTGYDFLDNW